MKTIHGSLLLALSLAACTTSHGFVNYKEVGVYAAADAGNKKFEDVGPVEAAQRGFFFSSCDSLAQDAVRDLLDMAKARGATTVYNVKFDSDNGLVQSPTCSTGWGWFALYGVGGLGPWVKLVAVEGVAAKFDGAKKENALVIPAGADTTKLAADFVAKMRVAE